MSNVKNVIKCSQCNRKMAEVGYFDFLAIKCPRCKTVNTLRTESPSPECLEHLKANEQLGVSTGNNHKTLIG